jgi:hypothetical protein
MPQHHGGQTGTLADAVMQASQAAIEACHAACWLRDEEAAGSNPATPTTLQATMTAQISWPFDVEQPTEHPELAPAARQVIEAEPSEQPDGG